MKALLDNQTNAMSHLMPRKVGALFMDAGTGKTRVSLELIKPASPDLVVWVGPLNTIRPKPGIRSVIDEIDKWGGFGCETVYTGIESLQQSDRIYLELRNRIAKASTPFIVIDESLTIKNYDAKRTRRMMDLSKMAEFKLVLNGTPLSKNLLDLKPQMDFLSPKILNMSNAEFKNTFCEYTKVTKKINGYKYSKEFITGYANIDHLYSLIRHYVFECDLKLAVKQHYTEKRYEIDEESKKEYTYLKERYLDDETLMWKNNNIFLEMTQKMQHQYCCTPSKFELLDEHFKTQDEAKTIIFCKYVASREACEKYFPKATVLSYQKEAQGLNLQHLNHTVYFDKIWDLALRTQSIHRTFRTGQEYDCTYLDMTGDVGLERLIDANIEKKIGMVEYFKGKTKEEIKAEL
jgi:SNF2 family DNA or RNA helicase